MWSYYACNKKNHLPNISLKIRGVYNRIPDILDTRKVEYLVGWVPILTARVPIKFC